MKRKGRLFDAILDWNNLQAAVHHALRGKRDRHEVVMWQADGGANLRRMAEQLRSGTFVFGRYHQFFVHDPKKRLITAPCLEERIAHHAVMNVVEPQLERWLIDDTFACRQGKGVHACLDRAGRFAYQHEWFLKLDVRKYFDSIDHQVLLTLLEKRFKDPRLLALLARLLASYCTTVGKGLPIGSLTSQHLANFYLGWLDRFVKETLRIRGYVRYMDDMAVWTDTRDAAARALEQLHTFAATQLRLVFKSAPYINRTTHGMDFLGCRVFHSHRTLNRPARTRFCRRLQQLTLQLEHAEINELHYQTCVTALTNFARTGNLRSWRFRTRLLNYSQVGAHEALLG